MSVFSIILTHHNRQIFWKQRLVYFINFLIIFVLIKYANFWKFAHNLLALHWKPNFAPPAKADSIIPIELLNRKTRHKFTVRNDFPEDVVWRVVTLKSFPFQKSNNYAEIILSFLKKDSQSCVIVKRQQVTSAQCRVSCNHISLTSF